MKFEKKLSHSIEITSSVNGGYVARVGCQTAVYTAGQEDQLVNDLAEYLKDPIGMEQKYYNTDGPQAGNAVNQVITEARVPRP